MYDLISNIYACLKISMRQFYLFNDCVIMRTLLIILIIILVVWAKKQEDWCIHTATIKLLTLSWNDPTETAEGTLQHLGALQIFCLLKVHASAFLHTPIIWFLLNVFIYAMHIILKLLFVKIYPLNPCCRRFKNCSCVY